MFDDVADHDEPRKEKEEKTEHEGDPVLQLNGPNVSHEILLQFLKEVLIIGHDPPKEVIPLDHLRQHVVPILASQLLTLLFIKEGVKLVERLIKVLKDGEEARCGFVRSVLASRGHVRFVVIKILEVLTEASVLGGP